MATVSYPTLEDVAMEARPYPADRLHGCETGLVLFAAAFLGHNDAIHFAEAGLKTTCIDVDGPRLSEMRALYPDDWEFVERDAWEYAEECRLTGLYQWDAVSADTFTGAPTIRSLGSLALWCSLARRLVTVTITDAEPVPPIPAGWLTSYFERARGVHWLILERA